MDKHRNWILQIGDNPIVLWSSHTDSVHRMDGYQNVDFDGKFITLPVNSKSNCLGADCAAGVWIMTEMIKAKVPGLYIFHFAEEIGCIGSRAIVNREPSRLAGIKSAIAFDRKGVDSVITHQRGRCCSDAFGDSLRAQLPGRYKLDPTGVLTDTKRYMGLVPECSNLSVGYYNEHQRHEALDVGHLFELRNFMVKIDPTKFAIVRDPKAKPAKVKVKTKNSGGQPFGFRREETLRDLVYWNADAVTSILENAGVTFDQLRDSIDAYKRILRSSCITDLFDNADQGILTDVA
jgi:hypothetical protein